jgi:hypothetical protein
VCLLVITPTKAKNTNKGEPLEMRNPQGFGNLAGCGFGFVFGFVYSLSMVTLYCTGVLALTFLARNCVDASTVPK